MKKGADDFLILIGIAVIVLIVVYFAGFVVQPFGPPSEETLITKISSLGSVGFVSEFPAKQISLGNFKAGEIQKENLKQISKAEIITGLFGSKKAEFLINIPKYYKDIMKRVAIRFTIENTNLYGNLVIKWNGKKFFNEKQTAGNYVISIPPENVEEINTFELYADGPGLMFWATTTYIIKNLDISLEYGPVKIYPFQVFSSDIETWKRGEVVFYGTGGHKLTIKVNGVAIYDKIPDGQTSANFTATSVPLKVGDNILSFTTKPGEEVQLFDTKLRIYLLTEKMVASRFFNISQAYLTLLQQGSRGKINYTIVSISNPGALIIKLNDKSLNVPVPKVGENILYFESDKVHVGENKIEFSGTGSFSIDEVMITLEKS